MTNLRTSAIAALLVLLPVRALAEPGAPLCAPLLSTLLASSSAVSPETAVADAWAELFLHEENARFIDFIQALAESGGPTRFGILALNPGPNAVDAASLEAADQLRQTIALLEEQGGLDRDKLTRELQDRTQDFIRLREEQRRIQENQRNERQTPPNPVRVIHTGGRPQLDLLKLRDGGFAVAAGREAFIFNADGTGLVKHEFPDDFVYSLIEGRDGSLIAVSQNAMVYRFDRQGNRLNDAILAGRFQGAPVELRDGRLAVGNISGVLFFVDPNGDMVGTYGTDGTIESTPIQLSSNGNIVVTSDDACVHFLDEAGNLLTKTCADYAFMLSPIELSNGSVFAVNPRGRGFIFDPNGTVLHDFERDWVVHTPVQGPNGTIALATDEGKILFLDETGTPTGRSYDAGSAIASAPVPVAGDRLAFADEMGRIHVIDWNGNDLFRLSRPEKTRAPIRDAGPDTLVVATETADIVFIDLKVLAELGR